MTTIASLAIGTAIDTAGIGRGLNVVEQHRRRAHGERGCRVRIEQKKPGGVFARVTWIAGHGRSQASLRTTSRSQARARGEAFPRALLAGDAPAPREPLTLEALWTRYSKEAPAYRQNTDSVQREKAARAELLLLGLGKRTLVERMTISDVERYSELRRRGTGWPGSGDPDPGDTRR